MARPKTTAELRRYFRRWFIVVFVATVLAWGGALVTYVKDRQLIGGATSPVVGQVVKEEKGFLGIRNILTVDYELAGRTYRRSIPTKGDGIGGPRVSPYFYKPGARVDLLVSRSQAGAVRTDLRWTPAAMMWATVGGFGICLLALLAFLRWLILRQRRKEDEG